METKCQQIAEQIQTNNKKIIVFDFDDTFAVTELYKDFSEEELFGNTSRKRCLFNLLRQSFKKNVDVLIYTNNPLIDDIEEKTSKWLDECNQYYKKNYSRFSFTDITISKDLSSNSIRIINYATISGDRKVWPDKCLMINALGDIYDKVLFADDQVVNFQGIEQKNVTIVRAPMGGLTHTQIDEITSWVKNIEVLQACKLSKRQKWILKDNIWMKIE